MQDGMTETSHKLWTTLQISACIYHWHVVFQTYTKLLLKRWLLTDHLPPLLPEREKKALPLPDTVLPKVGSISWFSNTWEIHCSCLASLYHSSQRLRGSVGGSLLGVNMPQGEPVFSPHSTETLWGRGHGVPWGVTCSFNPPSASFLKTHAVTSVSYPCYR